MAELSQRRRIPADDRVGRVALERKLNVVRGVASVGKLGYMALGVSVAGKLWRGATVMSECGPSSDPKLQDTTPAPAANSNEIEDL